MKSNGNGGFRLALPLLLLATSAAPAALVVSPTSQQFIGRPDNNYSPQTVVVSNSGPSALTRVRTISYSTGASNWLTFNPASFPLNPGETENQFHPTASEVDATGLPAGTHTATNHIDAGSEGAVDVIVTLTVSNFAALAVSPTSILYSVALGQNVSNYQSVVVSNSGDGTCFYTTPDRTYDTSGPTGWLNLNPLSGSLIDGGAVTHVAEIVSAATAFTLPGTYYATNEIRNRNQFGDPLITNAPLFLQVVVTVTGALPSALLINPGSQAFKGRPDTNYLPQTFVLSNTGGVPLNWTSTVAYGSGGSGWYAFAPTSGAIGAGASQTWTSRVDAAGLTSGVYVATNHFQAGVSHAADLVATLTVSTNYASLVVTPGSLSFNGTLGQDIAAAQIIVVSNNGFGPCAYTVETNAYDASGASGWLSVAPSTASLNDSGAQIHTVRIQNASTVFTNLGTFYATNEIGRVGSFDIANTPLLLPVTVTVSGLPAPTGVTATNDGNEFLRLGWTAAAGYSNLVLWHEGSPPDTDPIAGSNYIAGVSAIGNAQVIYRGPSFQGFEMMVKTNGINYFKVYHITNNTYSPATQVAATTGVYRADLIYEPFAFLNGLIITGYNSRGNGWLGAWTNTGATTIRAETNYGATAVPFFPNFGNFATNRANRVNLNVTNNNTAGSAYRSLPPFTSGTIYVSAILSPQYGGPGKYTGIRLYSNSSERIFFGELGVPTNKFGFSAGAGDQIATYDINPYDGGGGYTGNVYLVILRYNFGTKEANIKAYYSSIPVDATEPAAWDKTGTAAADRTYVNGLDFVSGGFNINGGDNQPGRTLFDEIRIATSWTSLLAAAELPFSGDGAGDQDGDGIPDAWESLYFGGPTNATATVSSDGDDFLNIEEYIADTIPTNGNSFFRRATNLTGAAVWTVTLQESSTGRVYDLYWKTNLLDTNAWQPAGLSVTGNGGVLNLVVTNTPPETFRRTGVRLP